MTETTTIEVKRATKNHLDTLKLYARESMDDVINRYLPQEAN